MKIQFICSEKRTVNFEEQIISEVKYPTIFSCQVDTIVYLLND